MRRRVTADRFSEAISEALAEYQGELVMNLDEAIHIVAEQTAEDINAGAPVRTGAYKGTWTSGYKKSRGLASSETVYAESPGYRLAHLLENGHLTRDGQRTTGKIVHIKGPYDKIGERLVQAIKEVTGG